MQRPLAESAIGEGALAGSRCAFLRRQKQTVLTVCFLIDTTRPPQWADSINEKERKMKRVTIEKRALLALVFSLSGASAYADVALSTSVSIDCSAVGATAGDAISRVKSSCDSICKGGVTVGRYARYSLTDITITSSCVIMSGFDDNTCELNTGSAHETATCNLFNNPVTVSCFTPGFDTTLDTYYRDGMSCTETSDVYSDPVSLDMKCQTICAGPLGLSGAPSGQCATNLEACGGGSGCNCLGGAGAGGSGGGTGGGSGGGSGSGGGGECGMGEAVGAGGLCNCDDDCLGSLTCSIVGTCEDPGTMQ
jgi:hypothetical protein